MNYTPDQQSVIDIRGKNILVSAAAGSGKTAVLVERIIKMVSDGENPVDIDRLLVLTFTNLAAGEMRERIGQAISRKLESDPENTHLQKQITLLHNAQITTIDSFCLFILRNHFHAIGLDPGYHVADEGELKLLKKEVVADLLEDWYESSREMSRTSSEADCSKDVDFLNCVEYFTTGSNDSILEDYIEKLYQMAMSFPWPEDWFRERKGDYEAIQSPWMKYLLDYTENILKGCICELEKAIDICSEADGPYMYGELLETELGMLKGLLNNDAKSPQLSSYINYQIHFETVNFARLPSKKDDSVSPEKREQVKNLRNLVKDTINETYEDFFRLSPEKISEIMAKIHPAVVTLLDLVLDYKRRLDKAKREKNIIDFGDMEHFALDILWEKTEAGLEPSAVAKELKKHFVTVMTDEYQDSNQVQELLLQSISAEDEGRYNRFMVGDVKQSIYKFRLARPEIFMEKYGCYAESPSPNVRIDLNQNFRSRNDVLSGVNYLFEKIMQKSLGGIEYDAKAALYPGAVYPENGEENRAELMLLDLSDEGADEPLTAEFLSDSKKELEARMIARRIREMVGNFKVTDKKTGVLRPVTYRDIVILLRTTKEWDEVFKKVLNEEGIPALTSARTGYFATSEIQTILQLINILDNPHQDIPLFGVMKSFFGGFNDEEIAVIKASGEKSGGLYEKLNEYNREIADQVRNDDAGGHCGFQSDDKFRHCGLRPAISSGIKLSDKITHFLHFIDVTRHKAIYTPIAELLRELVIESGYYHHIAVRPDGEQRIANLEMLLKKAASFAETSYYGLFHFVRYIEQLEKYDVDYGEANILDEQADLVRIMSVHKSKGLEFPVCFVAGLHKRINLMDSFGTLCMDVDLGLGVDYIDPQLRVRRKSTRKNVVSKKIKLDSLGEELRILYVAMTRAKEKLILTGLTKKIPSPDINNQRPSFLRMVSTGNFLELLMPLILSEAGKDIFSTRIWIPGDLVSEAINEIIDINHRRDVLLANLRFGQAGKISSQNDTSSSHTKVTQLSEKFAKPYPHANLAGLYAKTTVSELKRASLKTDVIQVEGDGMGDIFNWQMFEEPEIVPYIPKFMTETTHDTTVSSGSARGSAYHRVMELIDFARLGKVIAQANDGGVVSDIRTIIETEINSQIDKAIENGFLSAEYKDAVSLNKIMAFFTTGTQLSPLAHRFIVAAQTNQLYKEQPFVIGIDANRLNPDLPSAETILVQGIIDVFFEEADGLIIIDYKSDAVKTKAELITRYETQLTYYQEALEQLTGKKVKEKLIYSFALGEVISL